MIDEVKHYLRHFQQQVCEMIASEESQGQFMPDAWEYAGGGGGISTILEQGDVIEKGGVNFSHIFGKQLPPSATKRRPELAGREFQALGVSVVIHPRNPYVPTCHANFRFFYAENVWWFGGGFDLTPYYGFVEDCQHWHQMAAEACQPFGEDLYPRYKKACDDYFYLTHREEPRGIGGLFFDDINMWSFERCFDFIKASSQHFIKAYQPILARRKEHPYGEHQRDFQCYRRGRYVEFNLLHDRGTLFGLQSNGRVESILMSLPPVVKWIYNWHPAAGSDEEKLYRDFLIKHDWLMK